MPTISPLLNVPVPVAGDSDLVPNDMASAIGYSEPFWIGRFASAAERTTRLTAAGLGAGVRGMLSWNDSTARYETYNGTVWAPLLGSRLVTDSFAVYGANWDGVTPFIEYAQRGIVTVGASGLVQANFPVAFPNGLLYADIALGDNPAGVLAVVPTLASCRLNYVVGQALVNATTAVVPGVSIIVRYHVIGW